MLVSRIVYLLTAAFTLNVFLFYLVENVYYGKDFFVALTDQIHESFLFDLFGTCAQGTNYPGTSCFPF